jgi:hypothetical protein
MAGVAGEAHAGKGLATREVMATPKIMIRQNNRLNTFAALNLTLAIQQPVNNISSSFSGQDMKASDSIQSVSSFWHLCLNIDRHPSCLLFSG